MQQHFCLEAKTVLCLPLYVCNQKENGTDAVDHAIHTPHGRTEVEAEEWVIEQFEKIMMAL